MRRTFHSSQMWVVFICHTSSCNLAVWHTTSCSCTCSTALLTTVPVGWIAYHPSCMTYMYALLVYSENNATRVQVPGIIRKWSTGVFFFNAIVPCLEFGYSRCDIAPLIARCSREQYLVLICIPHTLIQHMTYQRILLQYRYFVEKRWRRNNNVAQ